MPLWVFGAALNAPLPLDPPVSVCVKSLSSVSTTAFYMLQQKPPPGDRRPVWRLTMSPCTDVQASRHRPVVHIIH